MEELSQAVRQCPWPPEDVTGCVRALSRATVRTVRTMWACEQAAEHEGACRMLWGTWQGVWWAPVN